ncbi:MAG: redox-regulated ATPase YchF [Alphaproteobacteria bacterium]|nr:redox-regulated ATPase YchF [Alphaproteobacteria bacterium]
MGFKCGIVGLPNVGKSTLFNALTATAAAAAENYPFCTIEPNTGQVPVPDERLLRLAALAKSAKTIPTVQTFVDIAGLVRGAAKGEGLGNQFLAHIREVDAIVHVLRCFEDANVVHVEGRVDPLADAETVETELMLADLDSLERRLLGLQKLARGGDREARQAIELVEAAAAALREGRPARQVSLPEEKLKAFRELQLLTAKPILYVCNVEETAVATGNAQSAAVRARAEREGAGAIVVSARIEAEVAMLETAAERGEFLASLGLREAGLARLAPAGHDLLGLITFFTAGPKEARAWTIPQGTRAGAAAGRIHSDFERGFIAAETIAYEDYLRFGGEQGAKEAGRMRQEGRDYEVKDGDVLLFRFNV